MGQFGMQGAEQGAAEHGRAPESIILCVAFRTTGAYTTPSPRPTYSKPD